MDDAYKTLKMPADGMFRDRNSRFLAFGFPAESTEQVTEYLSLIKKKYHDARHHCYAYRLGPDKDNFRMNDDGEPSGTAGKPIYNQIISHDLTDIMVIVVRYFGGTLLGTGGLINAYRSATADMIAHASIITRFVEDHYRLGFSYENLSAVMKVLKEDNLAPIDPLYEMKCEMKIAMRRSLSGRVLQKLSLIPNVTFESFNHRLKS